MRPPRERRTLCMLHSGDKYRCVIRPNNVHLNRQPKGNLLVVFASHGISQHPQSRLVAHILRRHIHPPRYNFGQRFLMSFGDINETIACEDQDCVCGRSVSQRDMSHFRHIREVGGCKQAGQQDGKPRDDMSFRVGNPINSVSVYGRQLELLVSNGYMDTSVHAEILFCNRTYPL